MSWWVTFRWHDKSLQKRVITEWEYNSHSLGQVDVDKSTPLTRAFPQQFLQHEIEKAYSGIKHPRDHRTHPRLQ